MASPAGPSLEQLLASMPFAAGAGRASTSTVASSTNLVRAVRDGRAVAVARPLNVGRSFIVVVEVRDAEGRLAAQVTQTQAVLTPKG